MARWALAHSGQPVGRGTELVRGARHGAARLALPNRGVDLQLVDIEAGGAGVYHMDLGTVADCGCHGVFLW